MAGITVAVRRLPHGAGLALPSYATPQSAGMDLLVQRFAAELKRFKQEPAYIALSAKYGGFQAITASEHAVEQQESSAP